MTDIKLLRPEIKPPRAEVVKIASEFMNDIATGKVDGFVLVALNRDGGISTFITPVDDFWRVLGALDRLKHRMHTTLDKNS